MWIAKSNAVPSELSSNPALLLKNDIVVLWVYEVPALQFSACAAHADNGCHLLLELEVIAIKDSVRH